MNQDISLLKCEEEKGSETEGKAYPVLNSLKLNFFDLYSPVPKKTLTWDYKPCRGVAAMPGRLMKLMVHIFAFAAASTQYQHLE